MNEIHIVLVKVISMFLYKALYRYMVSLSDQEILSWKSWAVVIGVQLLLFPVFLPPLSFLFLWWYSSYAPDQNLHNEGVINHGVEGRWINSKTKVIFEFVYVSIWGLCGLFSYGYLIYELVSEQKTEPLVILLWPITIWWAYIGKFHSFVFGLVLLD